jgi:hypothetical protein
MRQLEHCPDSRGTSKPLDGEDDITEWAALDRLDRYQGQAHA